MSVNFNCKDISLFCTVYMELSLFSSVTLANFILACTRVYGGVGRLYVGGSSFA